METPPFGDDRNLQLLLFGGKGGVGKTTCATAAALTMAGRFPEVSFLLVSIDPAHSLADCLGGDLPPDNLTTLELNAQECLRTFKAKHHRELLGGTRRVGRRNGGLAARSCSLPLCARHAR